MVKIAVAGGTGNAATHILKSAIASGKHEITVFTRSKLETTTPGVEYKQVDYNDRSGLTSALLGFHTCLSFIVIHMDIDCVAQKNLIHACIDAGVRRFAPSEWGFTTHPGVPPYSNKNEIERYLAELSAKGRLNNMEYCRFIPSFFMEYLSHPRPLAIGLYTWPIFIDFENRRAIILDDGNTPIALTAISDDAEILALALDDPRPWPIDGGIRGCRTTTNEIVAIGKEIRGGEWSIEHVYSEDIEKNELKSSWVPQVGHPTISEKQRDEVSKEASLIFLKAVSRGFWDVNDEWNRRFPEYKFMSVEEYCRLTWEGRP